MACPRLSVQCRLYIWVDRDSSVGIANRYGLDGPGIESRWGPGAHPASYTMGTGSFPGVKRPGRDVDHPPPSSARVKERVELYLYSPFGPSWPVLERTLPLHLGSQTHRRLLTDVRVMVCGLAQCEGIFLKTKTSLSAVVYDVGR
jgi:hypothetical protein